MDNNQTFLNACRNGQKSIVQIFLKREELTSTKGIRKETLLFIMPVRKVTGT